MHPRIRHHGRGGRHGEGHGIGRVHRDEGHGRPPRAEGPGRTEGDAQARGSEALLRGGHHRGGRRGDGVERQRTPRVLANGDLRLLLLALLETQPRHGYELIQLIAEMFHGQYAPSAGAVYPALAQLQELGLVEASEDGPRRLHTLTDAGRAFAHENAEALAEARLRTEHSARVLVKAGLPAPVRAGMGALKRSLASHHEQWKGDTGEQVAQILLRAAADIAKVGGRD